MGEKITERFLFLCFILLSAAATSAINPSMDFIQRSCGGTLYPTLCCSSLKPYASAVQQNPCNLAMVSANVSLAKIYKASSLAVAMLRRGNSGEQIGAALRDCVSFLGTAADLTKQAAAEMRKVGGTTDGSAVAWEVSNAQTWMSAAMTQEETCLDGFDGLQDGQGARAMCDRVGGVKKYTSIALALLNGLANGS